MKYIFVSDIHGNVEKFREVIRIFKEENADKLVFLGDTSSEYSKTSDEEIADILNSMKRDVHVIRGNCDTRRFEELLEFEMYGLDNLYVNGKFVTITHGHYYNMYSLPENCGDIFIQGHTHVPILQVIDGRIFSNPGSVSRPRGVDLRCYILIDEEKIYLKTLDGKVVKKLELS
ncbi:MAG: phosphodiesterase [Clostridia bacterium]|nr:phosphodiesterase [Clostridia bacterium]